MKGVLKSAVKSNYIYKRHKGKFTVSDSFQVVFSAESMLTTFGKERISFKKLLETKEKALACVQVNNLHLKANQIELYRTILKM